MAQIQAAKERVQNYRVEDTNEYKQLVRKCNFLDEVLAQCPNEQREYEETQLALRALIERIAFHSAFYSTVQELNPLIGEAASAVQAEPLVAGEIHQPSSDKSKKEEEIQEDNTS